MIVAVIAGRLEDTRFPGRNTFPLLGRPLMVYPLLAAQHAASVARVYVSTDAPAIARIARHHGVGVIERPPELSGAGVPLEAILAQAFAHLTQVERLSVEALVVLLANAPTVTGALIDQAVERLQNVPGLDAVMTVAPHNEHRPELALRLASDGSLRPFAPELPADGDVYFPDSLLWVLRPERFFTGAHAPVRPNWIVNPAAQRVAPLVHQGYGDVDHAWQIPAVEEWLRRQGFSEEATPYDAAEKPVAAAPAPAALPPTFGHRAARRVLITTVPFGEVDRGALDRLETAGIEYVINPIGRRLKEGELADLAGDFGVLIAGTEPITAAVMARAPHLHMIARVGIGLDNVDLPAARARGILVTYTPDAPAPAVAELTIGLMLNLLRRIPLTDRNLRNGVWYRAQGRRLSEQTVGVIGVGRVGHRVIRHLAGFGPKILANDLVPDVDFGNEHGVRWVDKPTIYREADIITLHVPLTPLTRRLITRKEIELMKPGAVLINTARGGMIDEHDLAEALRSERLAGAALDVFTQEPYSGELATLESCVLTCHMGSMSADCRARMEIEATEEVVRCLSGQPVLRPAPLDE